MKRKCRQSSEGGSAAENGTPATSGPPATKRSQRQPSGPLHMTTRSASKSLSSEEKASGSGRSAGPEVSASASVKSEAAPSDAPASLKRKRDDGALVEQGDARTATATTNGHETVTDEESTLSHGELHVDPPPKRLRGRPPKASKLVTMMTAEDAIAAEDAPAQSARRPPGRPRLGRPPGKRRTSAALGPGRRKKIEFDEEQEKIGRRQADLKKNYRDLAAALKPALKELAERTLGTLKDDPDAHEKSPSYTVVQAALEARLKSNVERLQRVHQLELEDLKNHFESQKAQVTSEFNARCEAIYENCLHRAQRDYMRTVRKIRREDDEDATDDETDPAARVAPSPEERPEASRSAPFLDAEHEWQTFLAQPRLGQAVRSYAPELAETLDNEELSAVNPLRDDAEITSWNLQALLDAAEGAGDHSVGEESGLPLDAGPDALKLLASLSHEMEYAQVEENGGASGESTQISPRTPNQDPAITSPTLITTQNSQNPAFDEEEREQVVPQRSTKGVAPLSNILNLDGACDSPDPRIAHVTLPSMIQPLLYGGKVPMSPAEPPPYPNVIQPNQAFNHQNSYTTPRHSRPWEVQTQRVPQPVSYPQVHYSRPPTYSYPAYVPGTETQYSSRNQSSWPSEPTSHALPPPPPLPYHPYTTYSSMGAFRPSTANPTMSSMGNGSGATYQPPQLRLESMPPSLSSPLASTLPPHNNDGQDMVHHNPISSTTAPPYPPWGGYR